MKPLILGTAGHIDHGKSQLVKALTGIDPDRLKEEKERGMTIDIGFAYLDLPEVGRIGIVDVPGHEKFVKNMLAGAVGIDMVMLVVDASEGVMPQTREHLEIVDLLGVKQGIVAITKVDIVDEELLELIETEIKEEVVGTILEDAPMVKVSSKTGYGLAELKEVIANMARETQVRDSHGFLRCPVDRVFSMRGFGTVVTGTLFSGQVQVGQMVEVLPSHKTARVREVQVHNQAAQIALAGQRTALNLANISVEELERGDTLAEVGSLDSTTCMDVRLRLLRSAPRPLRNRALLKLYLTTSQVLASVKFMEADKLSPGHDALARLILEKPLVALSQDSFVVRGSSPEITLGGGVVLDAFPEMGRKGFKKASKTLGDIEKAPLDQKAQLFLSMAEAGLPSKKLAMRLGIRETDLEGLAEPMLKRGEILSFPQAGETLYIHQRLFEELRERAISDLNDYFRQNPHKLGMAKEELRSKLAGDLSPVIYQEVLKRLSDQGKIEVVAGAVRLKEREVAMSSAQKASKEAIDKVFLETLFSPPGQAQLSELIKREPSEVEKMFFLLMEEGRLVRVSPELVFHREALREAREKILSYFHSKQDLSVGEFKDLLGISRKFAVPLLEYFDKNGLTKRVGDMRRLKNSKS